MQLDEGTRRITDVPELQWRRTRDGEMGPGLRDITFAGALEAATSVTPYPCSYRDILVHSGVAFRMRWFQGPDADRWVGAHSHFAADGPAEITALRETTGWQLWAEHLPGLPEGQTDRYVSDLCTCIDYEIPVLCYRRGGHRWDTGVVCGYADSGRRLLVRDYETGTGEPLCLSPDELHPFFVFLLAYNEPPSADEARPLILRRAVENWLRGEVAADETWYWNRYPTGACYVYGGGAFVAWTDALRGVEALPEAERPALFEANWSTFAGLVSARAAAATYLAAHAEIAGEPERTLLSQAAAAYRQEGLLLRISVEQEQAFLGPWTGKHALDYWTPDVRGREIDVLQEACRLEHVAMENLEQVVRLLDEAEVEYDDNL